MRLLCLVFASVLVLSCGGDGQRTLPTVPLPTQPTVPTPQPPTPPGHFVVSGTVRDDQGRPMVQAHVSGGNLFGRGLPRFNSTTDKAGRYSGSLPPGEWMFSVAKPGFTRYESTFRLSANTAIDVTLKPGVVVRGDVLEQVSSTFMRQSINGARVEVLSGENAGQSTLAVASGFYRLDLLPGELRIRASKEGYEPVEYRVKAFVDVSLNFTLKRAHGTCLQSVSPVLFDPYRAAGGNEIVAVAANPGRTWTATGDPLTPWLSVVSPSPQTGPGQLVIRILPYALGATHARYGAIRIQCSASEGENVWVVQMPDCQVALTPHPNTPAVFPAGGGTGHLNLLTGTAFCQWRAATSVDWIRLPKTSHLGRLQDFEFIVSDNRTGRPRTGTITVGEAVWTVTQR